MNTEIFRFTAIRTPQQASATKITENTMNLFNDGKESDFTKALQEARKESLESLISVAEKFEKTNKHIKSMNEVPSSFRNFNDFLLVDKGDIEVSIIKEIIKTNFQSEAKSLVTTDKFIEIRQNVSNSLLSSLILRNTPAQVQSIEVRLLQIIGAIEKIAKTLDDKVNLNKLMSTSFILPKGIFPLPTKPTTLNDEIKTKLQEEEKLKKQKAEDRQRTIEEIDKLKSSFSEIQSSMEEEKVLKNSSPIPKNRITKKGFYLETASANKLTKATKETVGALNFKLPSLDISVLLPKIESKICLLSQALYQDVTFESKVYAIGNTFVVDFPPTVYNEEKTIEEIPGNPFIPTTKGNARVLGIMDLLLVEQNLLHYEKGEIAHIENVLIGEIRERKHRRTITREESTFTESESTEEKEKDLTSTERYELQSESQNVINESLSFDAGVTANAYGVGWNVSAKANVAGSTSTSESNASSSNFAREITTKAVNKLTNRTLERRFRRTVEEIEENNLHSFNNVGKEEHIVGAYRWLDKIYEAQVVRYGKRLMLEFVVPEPAAFYRYAAQQQPTENISMSKPEQPGYLVHGKTFRPLKSSDITRCNYLIWANKYNASNVSPPPSSYQVVGKSFASEDISKLQHEHKGGVYYYHAEKGEIDIPDGYLPETAIVNFDVSLMTSVNIIVEEGTVSFNVLIDDKIVRYGQGSNTVHLRKHTTSKLPIAMTSYNAVSYGLTVTVLCSLSKGKYEEWQLKTFTAIMEAYNDQKARYESQLEAIRIQQGFGNITGKNPIFNRETERTELKKGCITLLTGQNFELFNSVVKNAPKHGYPEIVFKDVTNKDAIEEGSYIQFFEQSIEWTNMLYVFYPYFWSEKSQWVQLSQINDDDALFSKFLQAGAARVQVPVRPGFEFSVLTYLKTGQIWQAEGDFVDVNEDGVPDELQVSILDELKEGVLKPDENSAGEPVGDPWKVRVPTSLVVLDNYKRLSSEDVKHIIDPLNNQL